MKKIKEEISVLKKIAESPSSHHPVIDASAFLENIKSSVINAGAKWPQDEDEILKIEVRAAVAQIANNHGRTEGSIYARIGQKGLMGYR